MKPRDEHWVYLLSSNASEEYMADIIESIALPSDSVHHFRYRARWLSQDLKERIPVKGQEKKSPLMGASILIAYLHQIKEGDHKKWRRVIPIRRATLVTAYKTGDNEHDVVHFYMKLGGFVYRDKYKLDVDGLRAQEANWDLAFLGDPIEEETFAINHADQEGAFHDMSESFDLECLKSPDGAVSYIPLLFNIEGLRKSRGRLIKMDYDKKHSVAYYSLKEGSPYQMHINTSDICDEPKPHTVLIRSDDNLFSTSSSVDIRVSSHYDRESCLIVPRMIERTAWTEVGCSVKTAQVDAGEMRPLNTSVNILVQVHKRFFDRMMIVFAAVLLVIGTASVSIIKDASKYWWWWIPGASIFVLWAIITTVLDFRRG